MFSLAGLWKRCLRALRGKRHVYGDAEQLVDILYRKLLLRAPDPPGLANFTAALSDGRASMEDVLDAILTSPEFCEKRADIARRYYPGQANSFFADVSQFGEIALLIRAMLDTAATNKIVVDVGVMGREGSNSYDLLRWFGWRGLLVEANSGLIDSISEQFGALDYRIINVAVSDKAGTATLHIGASNGVSSLNEDHSRMFGPTKGQIAVAMETLPTILERENIPLQFDLLSIDIEGEDIKVLNNLIAASAYRPNWIIFEAGDVGAYRPGLLPLIPQFDEHYEMVARTQANLIFRSRSLPAAVREVQDR